eukprot:CAMPEP_0117026048 /NCGR_PEP_ID=MMETSP0472-20121206/19181_1 /TAXON_ID=693140 ORGANISM="Tiarina fusus, Strain LIS" /NCGR_SAMPLE_ID=MMETSP0472 /ASSEMBLY_ACC=CAM_ASM_000603 /LENGTH=356 /DNA_ID=CAMNT_0004732933 /DNA_START=161 /DNA_END=1231 /DNA_ORIENTATION=-
MPSSSSSSSSTLLALAVAAPLALLHNHGAHASRDDSYYRPGRGNPNTYAEKMYWEDASNVLEDLSSFSALYVEFHHCAWTQMKSTGQEDESVDESDYWYQGSMPPFGANVAFSLYGSLAGESFSGCNANTFINSFYTNYGFEVFSNAMYYAGQNGFSYIGDDDGQTYTSSCGGGYGVGCDFENGFAVHYYSSNECNPENFSGVSDKMSSFNSYMEKSQCVPIYKANNNNGYNGYYSGTPLELLAYSSACFYQNFWSPDGQCPDPYGKLAEYQQNFNEGVKESKKEDSYTNYAKQHQKAERMWTIGTASFIGAGLLIVLRFAPLVIRACRGSRKMPLKKKMMAPPLSEPTKPTPALT